MKTFVMDCSVTMAWCFKDEEDSYAEGVLRLLENAEAVVPTVWALEVMNVLLTAERKGRLLPAESERFIGLLGLLPITIDAASGISGRVMDLGRAHNGLSAYDAAYVELALRRGLPMATKDEAVRRALATLGIPLLSP
ncbi:MAG: type II toxin-antitoxin system VapC family toxin [Bacillota bacterium]